MRLRSIYNSTNKRVMAWSGTTRMKDMYNQMSFYPLPIIEFNYNELGWIDYDDDYERTYDHWLDINFKWILWCFTITIDWNKRNGLNR